MSLARLHVVELSINLSTFMRASFVVRLTLGLAALGLASGAVSLHCSHLGGAPLLNAGAASGLLSADVALGSSPQNGGSCAWMLQMSANSAEEGRQIALFDLRVRTGATSRRGAWFASIQLGEYNRESIIKSFACSHQIDSRLLSMKQMLGSASCLYTRGLKLTLTHFSSAHLEAAQAAPCSLPARHWRRLLSSLYLRLARSPPLFILCLENISCLTLPLTPAARFCRRRG